MAKIRPFSAYIFNQEKNKDLSQVTCPPYDVISPQRQDYFHKLHPHNFLHILLAKDIANTDKYVKAGKDFQKWVDDKILVEDNKPAIYYYVQEYSIKREKKTRMGFIALMKLEEKKSSVFGHEHTHLAPKEDRYKLIRQVKANLSPIFIISADKKRIIHTTWEKYIKDKEPFINFSDDDKVTHKLWRITDEKLIEKICLETEKENAFIADGHHRYEVSGMYRDELKSKLGSSFDPEANYNYIMAYFTNIDSPGLTIFPIHRLVKFSSKPDLKKILGKLEQFFSVEEIKDRTKFYFLMAKAGTAEHVIGMYYNSKHFLLRLKNVKVLDKIILDKPAEYRSLDVSILNSLVFENVLGLDVENKSWLTYNHEKDEIINQADKDENCIAFLLNPTKVKQIVSVALTGEKMPQKSTFFYPKVISGLVINKHKQ